MLAAAGMGLSVAARPLVGAVAACYLALTLGYSLLWRDIVAADIVVVATGFLVRAAAGGVATDVRLSRSFLVVTSACALFVVAGKRYAEGQRHRGGVLTRQTLSRYSPRALRVVLFATAAVAGVAYALWAFTRPASNAWLELSLVPFGLWLLRYRGVLEAGKGEAPEEVILGDRTLLLIGAVWTILVLTGVYAAR
jgi:decaprenyl-phosphate phosphoribosyltransferase